MVVTKEQVLNTICGMLDGDYDDELEVYIDAKRDPAYRGEAVLVLSDPIDEVEVARFRVKVEELS